MKHFRMFDRMSWWREASALIVAAASLALIASCGGSSSYSPDVATPAVVAADASPGGIWNGTDSGTGLAVTGLVDEAGEFHFIQSDGVQYVGTATTNADSLTATFDGYTQFGSVFADGSTHGTGTLTGALQARVSLTGATVFTTDKGAVTKGTIPLTFNPLYNVASSLATISGNYTNSGDVISVTSGGVVSWQDAASGCVGNGTISIINALYNAYRVAFTYSNCLSSSAVLNGVQFSGLATLDNSVTPVQALIGVTGEAGGVNYAVVLTLIGS